jgi:hypothetical protein
VPGDGGGFDAGADGEVAHQDLREKYLHAVA